MPRLVAPLVAAALLLAAPVAPAQQHGGYAGQQSREVPSRVVWKWPGWVVSGGLRLA